MKKIKTNLSGDFFIPGRKYLRIMKLIFIFMLWGLISYASATYSQSTRLTFESNEATIESVFKQIESLSEFKFAYNSSKLDVGQKISVKADHESIDAILDKILGPTDFQYKIVDRYIIINDENGKNPTTLGSEQVAKTVKGKVTDLSGASLPGVTVVVKGTTIGVITDNSGNYSISNIPENATLQFSFVGMKSQEASVIGKTTLNIKLVEDSIGIEEVVAVGYGTQKKVNLTGSVSSITSEVMESSPVQNVGQALQGIIPGLNISTTGQGGQLDQNMAFNIRGTGTIGSGSNSAPLVLIDGIEGDMNALNPQDIDNISVLKDAASSSIYGSRAAFGVILIKTKTGKQGKTTINYNNSFKISSPLNLPQMMDSYSFAQYFNEAQIDDGGAAVFSDVILDRILKYQTGELTDGAYVSLSNMWQYYQYSNANTDWFKVHYKNSSFSQEHNVNVNGGNEKMQYYVSGSFLNQNGILRYSGDGLNRYTFTTKLTTELSKHIKFNYTTKFIREDYEEATHQEEAFFSNINRRWPTVPVKDPNGHYTRPSEINQMEQGGRRKSQSDNSYNQGQLVINPLKGWNIYAEGNIRITNNNNHTDVLPAYSYYTDNTPYTEQVSYYPPGYSYVYEYNSKNSFYTTSLYSDYEFNIHNDHYFKVLGGFNSELYNTRYFSASGTNLISRNLPVIDLTTTNSKAESGSYGHWATEGFFGRLNYNYKERYLLEFNSRYDGSSHFTAGKRWNLFPSFSAGWNVAKEKFWKFDNIIQLLKIRGSYGELGNQNTSNWYPFYPTMPVSTNTGTWLVKGVKTNIASAPNLISSSLTWERVKSWNIGLDLGLQRNRLNINFDYFNRITSNMVGPAPELPVILGTSVPQINNAEMKSYGFELEMKWQDRIGSFKYSARAVLSDDQQEIMDYPNTTGSISTWYNGKKMNEIWGYTTIGIAKTQEEMDAHLTTVTQNNFATKWGAGDIMYADLNSDNKIDGGKGILGDTGDQKIIGNSTPRYRFSLDLNAEWKNFDIRILFQGIGKRDWMPAGSYFWGASKGLWQSMALTEHKDYFRDENSVAVKSGYYPVNFDSYYPKPYFNSAKNQQTQTRYLQNAAYMRLKNVQIGYNVPSAILSRIGISKLRIYASGENLLTFTKLSSTLDPEIIGLRSSVDGQAYPLSKVYAFGLSVNF